MALIFHITTAAEWQAAQAQGVYAADSLASQGFIHCSKRHQIPDVADRYYQGRHGLVLLAIAPARVEHEIRFENLEGGSESFPHIYGPLNLEAVTTVLPFEPDSEGHFHLPEGTPGG